jgi:GR25 family glycosyltransferase involved in LPS biosynthesis
MRFIVIHVATNQHRKPYVETMKRIIPELEVFDAVNGNTFTREEIEMFRRDGVLRSTDDFYRDCKYVLNRKITLGELGCYLSHVEVISSISAQSDEDGAVVLEDDVLLHPEFKQRILHYLHSGPKDIEFAKFSVFPNQSKDISV